MNVGLNRLDVFSAVGIMSSGTFGRAVNGVVPGAQLLEQISPGFFDDPVATNRKLRLLFFSCGTEDNRITALTKVEEELKTKQIAFTFKRYPGGHEWKVWRHSLVDMVPLLFQ
jgi:enterochelin esterase family protein